ncbi:MAG: ribulose-phosphate 3-epimerase [Gemmatimonadetes bacterium]|nr:ribulose-phosphate 3-epimerase [Gemmatimonadota bacterium]
MIIAPSILAADYARLGEEVAEAEAAGAAWFQVDVMDGHYVPNISIGLPVLESLRAVTDSFLDVHLMIDNPEVFLEPFAEAGADLITIHQEASTHLHGDLHRIRELGCYAGVAINPATPAATLTEVLGYVDLVLVMTVNPGFGGQKFIAEAIPKVTRVRELAAEAGLTPPAIQVDGGIDPTSAPVAAAAGASVFVAGSSVFRWPAGIAANFAALESSIAVHV